MQKVEMSWSRLLLGRVELLTATAKLPHSNLWM